jgi:hypothetical protein
MKNRSDLSKLYPAPKSYDDLQAERAGINALHKARAPKHIILTTSLRLYSILVALLLAILAVRLTLQLSVITAIFAAFLFFLLWIAYAGWNVRTISNVFYVYEANANTLLVTYVIIYPSLAFLAHHAITTHISNTPLALTSFLLFATAMHFALVYLLGKMTLKIR